MKRFLIATSIVGALLAFAPGIAAQVGAEVALRAAIEQETVKGDVNGAIEQYKKIVAQYPDNHAIAARALLRMAGSYEKLGNPEYKTVYARVAAQYADQPEATQARARLSAKAAETKAVAAASQERVWSAVPGVARSGSPSPDGNFIVYVRGRQLWCHDFAAAEDRAITTDGGDGENGQAWRAQVSPDGKSVAYGWLGAGRSELRIIGVDGSGKRVLLKNERLINPFAWSPDGARILVARQGPVGQGPPLGDELLLVLVATGSTTAIEPAGNGASATPNAFSPDGLYIVYAKRADTAKSRLGIWIMNASGGGETQILSDPNGVWMAAQPLWAPDGRNIIFRSDRSGALAIWSLAVADGKAQGSPQLVTSDNLNYLQFTLNGSLFYTVTTSQTDVHVAGLDPQTLVATSAPQRLNQQYIGSIFGSTMDWSPDGRSIVYTRGPANVAKGSFLMHSLDTNEEREIRIGGDAGFPRQLHYLPSGAAVLAASNEEGTTYFRRVDLQGGGATTVFKRADANGSRWTAALSPDGNSLFYPSIPVGAANDGSVPRLIRRDLRTGEEKDIVQLNTKAGGIGRISVSPDGRQVAFVHPDADGVWLMTAPADGGAPRQLLNSGNLGIAWTKDSKHLLFLKAGTGDTQLYSIPAEGGEAQPTGISMEQITGLALNPENNRVALISTNTRQDLWVYKNLLPPAPAQ
jgi:Tol biopolymer transport system component